MHQHIFLCGFMGCGKSTHGKKLAVMFGKKFTDLDQYIQKRENKTVQFIFDHEGEEQFRALESKYLTELIENENDGVISLGGGTVCFNNNLDVIKKNGVLIYIQIPSTELAVRLRKSRQQRPLLKSVSANDYQDFVEKKLHERKPFYESAHLVMDGRELSHLKLKNLIIDYFACRP